MRRFRALQRLAWGEHPVEFSQRLRLAKLPRTGSERIRWRAKTASATVLLKERVMSATLYVGHVAYETTEVSLQNVFERVGTVVGCDLMRDNFTGRPMGFAYVEMSSDSEATKAIEHLNGEEFNGHHLHVGRAVDSPKPRL